MGIRFMPFQNVQWMIVLCPYVLLCVGNMYILGCVDSLILDRCGNNLKFFIFKLTSRRDIVGISCEINLRRMPHDLADNQTILVQVMACCRQQTITRSNIDQVLWRYMVSLSHIEWTTLAILPGRSLMSTRRPPKWKKTCIAMYMLTLIKKYNWIMFVFDWPIDSKMSVTHHSVSLNDC